MLCGSDHIALPRRKFCRPLDVGDAQTPVDDRCRFGGVNRGFGVGHIGKSAVNIGLDTLG